MNDPARSEQIERPGYLLRRAHQVAVAIFADEVGGVALTPPQHNALLAISANPGLHQSGLSVVVGYDRATVGALLAGLEDRKLIKRARSHDDKRVRTLHLTARGERLLRMVAQSMARINERILAPLTPAERKTFVALLSKVVFSEANGEREA